MATALLDRPMGEPFAGIDGIVDLLSRREFVLAGAAAAMLAACGDDDAAPSAPPDTRVVRSATGDVSVPARPQRVVAIGAEALVALLDVGFTPVGVSAGAPDFVLPGDVAVVADLASVGEAPETSVEAVAALDPDLILAADYGTYDFYDALAAVAPTVFVAADDLTWEELTAQFAAAVGRAERLADVSKQYRDRAAEVRETHSGAISTSRWAIANSFDQNWNLFFEHSAGGEVLAELGIEPIAAVAGASGTQPGGLSSYSYEHLSLLSDADAILIFDKSPGAPRPENRELLDQLDAQRIPAAVAGMVRVSRYAYPTSYREAMVLIDEVDTLLGELESGE